MFQYISAEFTGSFLSYFIVGFLGMHLHAWAAETASERTIRIISRQNDRIERNMDKIEKRIDLIARQLSEVQPPPL